MFTLAVVVAGFGILAGGSMANRERMVFKALRLAIFATAAILLAYLITTDNPGLPRKSYTYGAIICILGFSIGFRRRRRRFESVRRMFSRRTSQ